MNSRLLIRAVLLYILLSPSIPMHAAGPICFEDVAECVDTRFAEFWRRNDRHAISGQSGNAARIFGYPIGSARIEAVDGVAVLAQPFERVIMQQPLVNTDPANITLQMTGRERLTQLNRAPTLPAKPPKTVPPDCRLFAETGFTLCGEFRNVWESNGLNLDNERDYTDAERIALFGLPISAVSREPAADGSTNRYLTQWFERARLQIDGVTRQIIVTPLGREVMSNRLNLPPLPRNLGVMVNPATLTAGSTLAARGSGYSHDRWVSVTVFRADGTSVLVAEQVNLTSGGFTETYCYLTPADAIPGIWAIAFDGIDSGRRTIGFFRVVTTGEPNRACPEMITPVPRGR
ncbi:hypothetical protein [Chloroflexus sp.]|uniref:hypothetical protein n=1 Tax=Chloroflexus sp. TaxID=1904827 RepID=UPI002ACEA875|nr:hypothetical protein [Chloroflexus sp.]